MSQQKESESDQLTPADIIQMLVELVSQEKLFKFELKFVR